MSVILSKAVAFLLIILLGQGLKRIGLFGPHDYQILSKIVMNLTLPASVITAFAAYQHDASFIAAFGIGLGCNLLLILLGLFLSRGKSGGERAYFICNLAGYNIGCFTISNRLKKCYSHNHYPISNENTVHYAEIRNS